jgi:hypothetical protein
MSRKDSIVTESFWSTNRSYKKDTHKPGIIVKFPLAERNIIIMKRHKYKNKNPKT